MDKSVYFSRGTLRSSHVHFAICPGGHIRLKPGNLPSGALVVDGKWTGARARVEILRVEGNKLVKIGSDCEPFKKSAVLDVVKEKLLSMPSKVAVYAAEVAWRAIMARKNIGALTC